MDKSELRRQLLDLESSNERDANEEHQIIARCFKHSSRHGKSRM